MHTGSVALIQRSQCIISAGIVCGFRSANSQPPASRSSLAHGHGAWPWILCSVTTSPPHPHPPTHTTTHAPPLLSPCSALVHGCLATTCSGRAGGRADARAQQQRCAPYAPRRRCSVPALARCQTDWRGNRPSSGRYLPLSPAPAPSWQRTHTHSPTSAQHQYPAPTSTPTTNSTTKQPPPPPKKQHAACRSSAVCTPLAPAAPLWVLLPLAGRRAPIAAVQAYEAPSIIASPTTRAAGGLGRASARRDLRARRAPPRQLRRCCCVRTRRSPGASGAWVGEGRGGSGAAGGGGRGSGWGVGSCVSGRPWTR